MNATLTTADINTLKSLRTLPEELAKNLRACMFTAFKTSFGIPQDHKVKVEVDEVDSTLYGTIVRKTTGQIYPLGDDGKWLDPAAVQAAVRRDTVRWFAACERSVLAEYVYGQNDFEDGDIASPTGTRLALGTGELAADLIVDPDGDLWIGLTEAQFDAA